MSDRPKETQASGKPTPCLFLSHSGADTDAARELKRRILESPEAQGAGLAVWFDKDDLAAGGGWQEQIEIAITRRATAFAVYVGSNGVMNWVDREVRLGLSRATADAAFPFVPILAQPLPSEAIAALPAFAQQLQGVIDPLYNPEEFAKLIDAILRRTAGPPPRLIDEPFVGLRAMTEKEANRFFGREAETLELVEDLRRNRLVAIVADSGAGKSSLAMAGLAPAYRGGALADPARRAPDDALWHVVVMRPGENPAEGLRRGVTEAAERMGLPPDVRAGLRRRVTLEDANETAYALRCDLPASVTQTLLIVDQFDELLTETPEADRGPFVDFLLKLVASRGPSGFHVVLTIRVDYFNLCRPYGALYGELKGDERVLRLKRISDAGLEQAVRAPLRMAGFADESEQKALAAAMRRDLGDRPGDLALAQMALWTVWRNRRAHAGSLLGAYIDVGGVSGALAQEAERVRTGKLDKPERALLPALLVRLVRLGETGGVLRRLADRDEFDAARLALAQKLASDDYGRLLLIGEGQAVGSAKIEVCHEALITQWPWLQNTLNAAAADLRALERLIDRATRWRGAAEGEREKYLAMGAERELFGELRGQRDAWLAAVEREFIAESDAAYAREETAKRDAATRERFFFRASIAAAVVLLAIASFAAWEWRMAAKAEQEANTERAKAEKALILATNTAYNLVTKLVQKLRYVSGVPQGVVQDILAQARELLEQLQQGGASGGRVDFMRAEMLTEAVDSRLEANDTKAALNDAREAAAIFESLSASKWAQEFDWVLKRELAVAYEKIGNALRAQGDGAAALISYRKSHAIIETLVASDPAKDFLEDDLAGSYARIGDLLLAQKNVDEALKAYRNTLTLLEKRLDSDPGDARLQRNLSLNYVKIGNALQAEGDATGALKAIRDGLAIIKKLSDSHPGNTEYLRDLEVHLNNIGATLDAQNDLPGALNSFRESFTIAESLSASDPGNAQWRHDLAVGNSNIGRVLRAQHDWAGARDAYSKDRDITETLSAANPGNAKLRYELIQSYLDMASVEPMKFHEYLLSAKAIAKELAAQGQLVEEVTKISVIIDNGLKIFEAPTGNPPSAAAGQPEK